MNLRPVAAIILCFLAAATCRSSTSTRASKLEIPFTLRRNVIILPVRIGDSRELRIILDTGMHFEGVLVYNPELRDSIVVENGIEVRVPGAGADSASRAIMTDSGAFDVGGVEFTDQRVIVLQNEMMRGFPSDGVTGYSLLGKHVVEIDYDRMRITLHEPEGFLADTSWHALPLTFKEYQIPWIEAKVNIGGTGDVPVSLYIDLASNDTLEMLIRKEMKFALPDSLEDAYLGRGLSGDVHGFKGRIHSLTLGSFVLEDVLTSFAPAEIRSKQAGADGILGSGTLRRFNVIFDYRNAKLYLKPNSFFSEPF